MIHRSVNFKEILCWWMMLKDISCYIIVLRNDTLHLRGNIFHRPGSSLPSMIPMMFVMFLFSSSFLTSNLTFLEKKERALLYIYYRCFNIHSFKRWLLVLMGYRSLTNFLLVFHILVQFCRWCSFQNLQESCCSTFPSCATWAHVLRRNWLVVLGW